MNINSTEWKSIFSCDKFSSKNNRNIFFLSNAEWHLSLSIKVHRIEWVSEWVSKMISSPISCQIKQEQASAGFVWPGADVIHKFVSPEIHWLCQFAIFSLMSYTNSCHPRFIDCANSRLSVWDLVGKSIHASFTDKEVIKLWQWRLG